MSEFSAYVAFDKATNGQSDITHEMGKNTEQSSLFSIIQSRLSVSLVAVVLSPLKRPAVTRLRNPLFNNNNNNNEL